MTFRAACVVLGLLFLAQLTFAQSTAEATSGLPRLVRFGGTIKDLNGNPMTGVVGITFALYSEQSGGAALWLETQNVTADSIGHYVALLGLTKPDGLPADLFTTEQARWVGVQISGQAEQPRVLLVSAPYALKAGDAETVGGLPPSAFVLAEPRYGPASASHRGPAARQSVSSASSTDVTTSGGTVSYLPLWDATSDITSSVVFQSGTGSTAKVGVGTSTPSTTLEVTGSGKFSGSVDIEGDTRVDYNGLNKGTTTPAIRFGAGGTGEAISSDRAGTVNVNGIDLYTNSTPRLSITNGGSVGIGTTTPTATLDIAGTVNTGTSYNLGEMPFVFGNLSMSNVFLGFNTGNNFTTGEGNTGVGTFALYDITGTGGPGPAFFNTAVGTQALWFDTLGQDNTANGAGALQHNTTGNFNTAAGSFAGNSLDSSFVTGSSNTFLGNGAGPSTGSLNNAAAVGAWAQVSESNAIVLGGISGVNGCNAGAPNYCASVNVGIGTNAPRSVLDVDASVPSGLGPTVTLTNNGGSGKVSLDFNTYAPFTTGTYNPSARILVADAGHYNDTIYFQANKAGAANNGLQTNVTITSAGLVGIGTTSPDNLLTVNGSADKSGGGSWGTFSDGRLKNLNGNFSSGLNQILRIHPIRYRYKPDNAMGIRDTDEHVGVVAQDVQRVIPEAVTENSKGYLLVNNDPIIWSMVNAIKEQEQQIKQQQTLLRAQAAAMRSLKAEVRETRETLRKVKAQVAATQPAVIAAK